MGVPFGLTNMFSRYARGAGAGSSTPSMTANLSSNYTASNGQVITPQGTLLNGGNVPSINALQERNQAIFGNPQMDENRIKQMMFDIGSAGAEERFKANPTNVAAYEAEKSKLNQPIQGRIQIAPGSFSTAQYLASKYPDRFKSWSENDWNYIRSQDPLNQTDSMGNRTTTAGHGNRLAGNDTVFGDVYSTPEPTKKPVGEISPRDTSYGGPSHGGSITNTGVPQKQPTKSPTATPPASDNGYTPKAPDGGWTENDRIQGYDQKGNPIFSEPPPRMKVPTPGEPPSIQGNPQRSPGDLNRQIISQGYNPEPYKKPIVIEEGGGGNTGSNEIQRRMNEGEMEIPYYEDGGVGGPISDELAYYNPQHGFFGGRGGVRRTPGGRMFFRPGSLLGRLLFANT